MRYDGACHCRNLTYVFETTANLETLGLRSCMCSFCRGHGARTTSDPTGSIRITLKDPARLQRYRFGLKTADFLICRDCGVFIGALMEADGRHWMTLNANTLLPPPGLDAVSVPHVFDGEDESARVARREAKWTPVTEFPT